MNRKILFPFLALLIIIQINCFCQELDSKYCRIDFDTLIVCKIASIKSATIRKNMTDRAYIIIAQDTSSKKEYTIVSLKSNNNKLPKIENNNIYTLRLSRYFELDLILDFGRFFIVELDGYIIAIPTENCMNIYITPNLLGLGYNNF